MNLDLLGHHPELLQTLADWYLDEWGYLLRDSPDSNFERLLQPYLNTRQIPLIVIAHQKDELIGAAQLKNREMSIFPKRKHWLGGVYVSPSHRGKGVAADIIAEVVSIARRQDVQTLHLQSKILDGGLYRRLGWQAVDRVHYQGEDVVVMERGL